MSLYSADNSINLDKNDLEFLKKNKVIEIIQEGLISLCQSRPEEPFQYLIDFYSNQETKIINFNDIEKEMLLTDYKSPSFFMTLQNIYNKFLLCNNYKDDPSKSKIKNIFRLIKKNRSSFRRIDDGFCSPDIELILEVLLEKDKFLSINIDINESTVLIKKISLKPYTHVTFSTFRYLVIVSLCFKDYLGMSNQIYDMISETKKSRSEYVNFCVILSRLAQWLDNYPQLDSTQESRIKNRDVFLMKQTNDSMNRNQFNMEAVKIFLEKKVEDNSEIKPADSNPGFIYKIGTGIVGGVCGVASTGFTIVKSGSSVIYNNIPWRGKTNENIDDVNQSANLNNRNSDERAGWFSKRKDKCD